MNLAKDRDQLRKHTAEAHRRLKPLAQRLVDLRQRYHRLADEAWARGDVVEHRIWCLAANELAGIYQQLPRDGKL